MNIVSDLVVPEAGAGFFTPAMPVSPAPAENLNAETLASNPILASDRQWGIRFHAGTATIVLGMKDYGRGWFSAYFASIVARRLGIPFRTLRVYYSGTSPAVLQSPRPPSVEPRRSDIGPIAGAVADLLEVLCDRVVEKGRLAFAASIGAEPADVAFEPDAGRFFTRDYKHSETTLGMAALAGN